MLELPQFFPQTPKIRMPFVHILLKTLKISEITVYFDVYLIIKK